ncbi:MAG: PHP domain-containing protein, partial [Erysipelotrichaceae bacterium]|nr:PHP domain-containing protein [Erysipelotrichaceae bacterium]
GVELQTKEEVHVLGYFKSESDVEDFDGWLRTVRDTTMNRIDHFGNQYLLDENDEILGQEGDSLILSLNASLNECVVQIKKANGRVVLAHVMDRKNGILRQLAFIPKNLNFDGIEITKENQKDELLKAYPWLKDKTFFLNSDAHRLIDIHDAGQTMSEEEIEAFWRNEP